MKNVLKSIFGIGKSQDIDNMIAESKKDHSEKLIKLQNDLFETKNLVDTANSFQVSNDLKDAVKKFYNKNK